jgi:hypothetical protein
MNARLKTCLFLFPLILLLAWCVLYIPQRPLSDFANYYFGGKELLKGTFMNAYDMEVFNFSIAAQGYKDVYACYAPFPPFTSLVFAPFTIFQVITAKIVFGIFSGLFFVFTSFRAVRYFALPEYTFLLIPVIFFTPITNNIFFGQSYLLLFCLLLEGFLAFRQGKVFLSSFLWGIAILLKVFPVVVFLYLLLKKKYREFLWLGIACVLLLLLSVGINGMDSWQFYLTRIVPKLNAGGFSHPFTYAFQSFYMLGKKLFVYDQLLNPIPFFKNPFLFVLWMGLFKAAILSACITFTVKHKEDDFLSFSIWMLTSILISPNGSTYSLVLLLVLFFAISTYSNKYKLVKIVSLFILGLACNLSIHKFGIFPVGLQFPRLYLLLVLFVLLLRGKKAYFNPLLFTGLVLVFILPSFFKTAAADKSRYLLDHCDDLFVYDYTVENNRLIYFSWDGKKNEIATGVEVHSFSKGEVSIRDNQVYYLGKKMTSSPDWKKNASLLDGHTIVYLSDKDRGVCFYTLRAIDLGSER